MGNSYIQLGSVRSRDGAQESWKKFQAKFPQLEKLTLRIQEADLGAKGMYYRVQGGPVAEIQAKAICRAVQEKQPGGCLVISH